MKMNSFDIDTDIDTMSAEKLVEYLLWLRAKLLDAPSELSLPKPPERFYSLEEAEAYNEYCSRIININNKINQASWGLKDKIERTKSELKRRISVRNIPILIGNAWVTIGTYSIDIEEIENDIKSTGS